MTWEIIFSGTAKQEFDKLPQEIGNRIASKLKDVREEPFTYIEQLKNSKLYKLRVGDYRILMTVLSDKMILHLVKVAKRSKVYD